MMQTICAWIIILSPTLKLGYSITKEIYSKEVNTDKSAGIVASIIVVIGNYLILYYAGVFNLIK